MNFDQKVSLQDMKFNVDRAVAQSAKIPENPGPSMMGKTPIIGSLRRANDIPVARDELNL